MLFLPTNPIMKISRINNYINRAHLLIFSAFVLVEFLLFAIEVNIMDFKARVIPTQAQLKEINSSLAEGHKFETTAIELILNLLNTADISRDRIMSKLKLRHNISEGRFIMLMALNTAHGSMSMGHLSEAMGITNATLSIMVKRMLKEKQPLIEKRVNDHRKSSYEISISPYGQEVLDRVTPEHFADIEKFTSTLNYLEKVQLLSLVKKLVPQT